MNKLKILILIFLINSINAQFYFGRNKIQFNQFNWNVLETEHFQIYYYEQEKELALAGAKYVEDAYKDISKKINFSLIDPVPLIFYSSHLHFQQTNTINRLLPEGVGGFFEFIKGRVVIPYSGDNTQFRNVIKHELIHVLMHQKINKSLSLHNVQTYRSPPLWFTEGIAEYWSSVWDARTEMVIRDAIVNEYLGSLDNYSSMASGFLLYFISAILYIYSLKKIDLSIAYPTISLSYIAIIFLSFLLFGETITLLKIIGCAIIILGVFLVWV